MTSKQTSDKPGFRTSIGALAAKAEKKQKKPYTIDLGDHGSVNFPDPLQMAPLEAEEMLTEVLSPSMSLSSSLRRWLADDDQRAAYDKALLDGTIPSFGVLRELSRDVTDYYGEIFGMPGEGPASRA